MYSQISREIQCYYFSRPGELSFEQLTPAGSGLLPQCEMSLELTNRDPTHTITLKHPNMALLVLSGVREVQVMLDIVHAGQNNVVV